MSPILNVLELVIKQYTKGSLKSFIGILSGWFFTFIHPMVLCKTRCSPVTITSYNLYICCFSDENLITPVTCVSSSNLSPISISEILTFRYSFCLVSNLDIFVFFEKHPGVLGNTCGVISNTSYAAPWIKIVGTKISANIANNGAANASPTKGINNNPIIVPAKIYKVFTIKSIDAPSDDFNV